MSKTFIQLPSNVGDSATLRRFLAELILRLDIAFGNRARSPFASTSSLDQVNATLGIVNEEVATLQTLLQVYTDGFNQPAQASLTFPSALDIDAEYDEAQVQQLANDVKVLADKIDSLLVVLRNAKIISI